MRKNGATGASCTLTVFHDGQFWVGVAERRDGTTLEVARVVFGAEPSDEQIYQLVLTSWHRLRFAPSDGEKNRAPAPAGNPKRRQREAARETARARPSTAAQEALTRAREERRHDAAARRADLKNEQRQARYEQRREKRRRKRRGH